MSSPSKTTVFYSWQSDAPSAANRALIRDALNQAIKTLADEGSVVESPRLDHDTQGVPGSPDIGGTILAKVDAAAVFVADVSLVVHDQSTGRKSPNPNVLFELGYAWAKLGHARVILVMNEHFGPPNELPFDLRSRRVFAYRNDPSLPERSVSKRGLASDLQKAIRTILAAANLKTSLKEQNEERDPEASVHVSLNNAANVIAKRETERLYMPRRAMLIEPLPERGVQVDRLAFVSQVASSGLSIELSDRAGFASLRSHPRRSSMGLVWSKDTDRGQVKPRIYFDHDIDRIVSVGFDGSCFVACCLDEFASSKDAPSQAPVDIGRCVDTMVASLIFSSRVRQLLQLKRPAEATFYLEGISGLHAVFGHPSPFDFSYPTTPPVAHTDAFQKSFNVAAKFGPDSIRDAVLSVCKDLEYVFGTHISREYVEARVTRALSET